MKTISKPETPAYSPAGFQNNRSSQTKNDRKNQQLNRSNLDQHRLSIRNSDIHRVRGSVASEVSVNEDQIEIPKVHEDYYNSLRKRDEIDNQASWISFILYEEYKKMETLAQLEEEGETDLSLLLKRRRSAVFNIPISTKQEGNFTNNLRPDEDIIVYDSKKYYRRRGSSVIRKIGAPMPKEIIE